MRRRLVISYVVLVAVALALFTGPVAISSSDLLRRTLEDTARREGELFVPLVLRDDADADRAIRDRTRDFEQATGSRVRLVRAPDVPASSLPADVLDPTGLDDPQVAAALAGAAPDAVWGTHPLLDESAVSVVIPVERDGEIVAVVQVVASAVAVDDEIAGIWRFRITVGALVLLVAAGLAVLLSAGVTRPLARLNAAARRLGEGSFDEPAAEDGPPEVAALARTLNRSTRRTAELLESQRAFVADASHQLRTPLTAMRLTLDTVREVTDDETLGRRLDAVDADLHRMNRIVEGLLDLARAEARNDPPRPAALDDLVRERLELWEAAFEDAAVTAAPRIPPGLALLARPGAVEQILDNVLDNALAAAPAGTRIELLATPRGHEVELRIGDEGAGMSEEQRSRAFDRFWTSRPGGGSGLGLAVVRRLVEHDGGSVEIDTAPGRGTTVVLTWPRAQAARS